VAIAVLLVDPAGWIDSTMGTIQVCHLVAIAVLSVDPAGWIDSTMGTIQVCHGGNRR